MDTQKLCQNCRVPLAANAPRGLCPACLMKVAMATGTVAGQEQPGFTPPSTEELARKFPQLDIIELIGRGGMGAVYKARQKELDRIVALKILPPGIGGDPAFAERFAREAKALARLNHPGIVTIYDSGRTDGLFYFLMEFVDGVSLGRLMHGERLSPRDALAIVPQICDALQYAHDQGIVHRDIKPENILLDRLGRVKVADFGLAKLVGADALTPSLSHPMGEGGAAAPGEGETPILTEAGKIMGTPAYMAPEQAEHPAAVDHRADIYALGVVFYQMLTGELPGKRMEPPSKKVQIDVRLDEVVMRALEQNPQLRYQQVSEVKTMVETIVATPPSSSRREEAQTEAARPRQTWWTWWLFQSPDAGQICAHLTKEERKHLLVLLLLYSVWVMVTTFGIPALNGHMRDAGSGDWIVTAVWAGLFIVSLPMIARMMRHFFCSTDWARKQGITPGKLRLFSFSARRVEMIATTPRAPGESSPTADIPPKLSLCYASKPEHAQTILHSGSAAAASTGQVEAQGSKFSWIGSLPKLNDPFVVERGNRRVLNWPVIGVNLGMGLAIICVVLPIVQNSMSFHGSRANLIELLFFGLFAVVYIVGGWRKSLSALESQAAEPGIALASAPRPYRLWNNAVGAFVLAAWALVEGIRAGHKGNVGWAVFLFICVAYLGMAGYRRARAAAQTEAARPRQDWWTWSPLQSREVGEICAHLTKAERNHLSLLGLLSAVWILGTWFGIPAFIRSQSGSGKWIVASVWVILFAVTIPMLLRMARHFLCSTTWARERGFAPGHLRLFSFSRGNLWRLCAVLAVGLGLVFAQHSAITSYLGLGSSPQPAAAQRATGASSERSAPGFTATSYSQIAPRQWLDLETGTLARMPRTVFAGDSPETGDAAEGSTGIDFKRVMDWAKEEGVDLCMEDSTNHSPGFVRLRGSGMKVIPLTSEDWNDMTAPQLVDELRLATPLTAEKDAPGCVVFGSYDLPATYGFATRKGSVGILQITGFTSNPHKVNICYKLVRDSKANVPLGPSPASAAGRPEATFGPEMEQILPYEGAGKPGIHFISFKSGQILTPPMDALAAGGKDAFARWMRQSEADAVAELNADGSSRLFGFDHCSFFGISSTNWGDTSAETLIAKWPGKSRNLAATRSVGSDSLPETFLFKTADGVLGLGQITSFTDNPRGVKIRFKLVRSSKANAALKPIPPKAMELAAAWRAYAEAYVATHDMKDTNVNRAFGKESNVRIKEIGELLRGTIAEPLWNQQHEQIAALQKASQTKDMEKVRAASDQLKATGTQLDKMLGVEGRAYNHKSAPAAGFQFRWVAAEGDTDSPADLLLWTRDRGGEQKLRVLREVVLDGDDVASAGFTTDQPGEKVLVVFLTDQGVRKFAEATAKNVGRQLAIVWHGWVISAPVSSAPIAGRRVNINGLFSDAQAQQLLDLLNHRTPGVSSLPP